MSEIFKYNYEDNEKELKSSLLHYLTHRATQLTEESDIVKHIKIYGEEIDTYVQIQHWNWEKTVHARFDQWLDAKRQPKGTLEQNIGSGVEISLRITLKDLEL